MEQLVEKNEDLQHMCKCSICYEVLIDPMRCENCENHYCKQCILKCENCPLCRNFKGNAGLRLMKNLLSSLKFYCENKDQGCVEIIRYDFYGNHIDQECEYRLVKCKYFECQATFIKINAIQHYGQCPYEKLICQWCTTLYFRQDIINHQLSCEERKIQCQMCDQVILYINLDLHNQICPEKNQLCQYCQNMFKLKFLVIHMSQCDEEPLNCSGCLQFFKRKELQKHIEQCQEIQIFCENCEQELKKKVKINEIASHQLSDCIVRLKDQIKEVRESSNLQIQQLRNQINQLQNMVGSMNLLLQNKFQNEQRFIQSLNNQDIVIENKGSLARVNNLFQINQIKDRFVFVEFTQEIDDKIQIKFKFLSFSDNFVAVGIADINSLQKKKDFYQPHHMSYLISANGVIFISHQKEENGKKKDFKFTTHQVIQITFDLVLKNLVISNTAAQKTLTIDIPKDSIEYLCTTYYPVVCLRGQGDSVIIVN